MEAYSAALIIVDVISKIYIVALLYSFYFLLREVVFFEHLLQSAEAMNADAAFSSSGASSSAHSQVSGGVFSLTPRINTNNARRRNDQTTYELRE